MATINYTENAYTFGNVIYQWDSLTTGDDGQPAGTTGSGDRTVQVQGTFGASGTVLIEGTLDMLNWYTLRDAANSSLSFGSAGLKTIMENVVAVKPRVSNGDGTTSIQCILSVRRDRNG